jgi:tetratricopeptide (TPR) repeat protein
LVSPMRKSFCTLAVLTALSAAPSLSIFAQTQMPACHAMPHHQDQKPPSELPAPEHLTGIGNDHFPISSKNPETQQWFDQGINLTYDFWDYEAKRAFEQAIRTDPNCAICHWALATALGSRRSEMAGYAHDELMKAVALRSKASAREKLYIDAEVEDEKAGFDDDPGTSPHNDAAKTIRRQIVKKYPSDIVGRIMLSEAVIEGYDKDGKPKPGTVEALAILQGILKDKPDDSAANHLWIHAVEASPHPEQALHSADILATLAPNSGHMTHMPGHIFFRTGNYERAQVSFDLSTSVDEGYMKAQHVSVDDDWNYVHNLMYSVANLMEEGHMQQAAVMSAKLTGARGENAASLYPWSPRDSITRVDPMLPLAMRAGDWPRVQKMVAEAHLTDASPTLEFLARILTNYAKGMQAAQDHNLEEAKTASNALDAELWRFSQQTEAENAVVGKGPKPAQPINQATPTSPMPKPLLQNVAILSLELRAAILVDQKKIDEAQKMFEQARKAEQDLGYREPPAFIRPVAEQEAAIMMAAGETKTATDAWRHALEDRSRSGFALYGLAAIAEKEGDTQKATAEYQEFLTAWKTADPDLPEVAHAKQWLGTKETQSASVAGR